MAPEEGRGAPGPGCEAGKSKGLDGGDSIAPDGGRCGPEDGRPASAPRDSGGAGKAGAPPPVGPPEPGAKGFDPEGAPGCGDDEKGLAPGEPPPGCGDDEKGLAPGEPPPGCGDDEKGLAPGEPPPGCGAAKGLAPEPG